ncbi:MAG: glycogen synthase [Cellvibrionaceae bacterium]|nr:glycogen synthase [Cellvibrionaceae bacterium]
MQKRILMVASENDALPGAKVGGVGDVIRDLPTALTRHNQTVDVLVPSYGFLSRLAGMRIVAEFEVRFAGKRLNVELLLASEQGKPGVRQFVLHHATGFSEKGEMVYCDDDEGPFATDATKFALFCQATAEALKLGVITRPDVLHCHDWHSAFLLILLRYSRSYKSLRDIKTVFSIHNLAMQGIRPLRRDSSSMVSWFPGLALDLDYVKDLRYPDCINPMRAAILLADKVHTVSPSYAEEILKPSDHEMGIYGGEGLEKDLKARALTGDLLGILNGCEYPEFAKRTQPDTKQLCRVLHRAIEDWASRSPQLKSAHWMAHKRVEKWSRQKQTGKMNITSIGRVTEQKYRLLHTYIGASRKTTLESMLDALGDRGTLFLLGSGDTALENFLLRVAGKYENFIFLNGYSSTLSDSLYEFGDLFLMPSSYEPCGISQMQAMRAGQPCFVNSVGGLKDTVQAKVNGFSFSGYNAADQAEQLFKVYQDALKLFFGNANAWKSLCSQALAARFSWDDSAKQYLECLYDMPHTEYAASGREN